jgi:hypothetical protein
MAPHLAIGNSVFIPSDQKKKWKKVMAAYSCSILADRAIIFEEGETK